METMALGMLSIISLVVSGCCLYCKKPGWGLLSSMTATALIYGTGYCWRAMLMASGKDTTLLGFSRYPAAPVLLCILALGAVIGMIVSIVLMIRNGKK